jgi:hypothetical protein
MYVLELLDDTFVLGYSNTFACLRATTNRNSAKKFNTEADAVKWASRYAPGYKVKVVLL